MVDKSPVPRVLRGLSTPKTIYQVLELAAKADLKSTTLQKENYEMLRAKYKRYANRNIVVGKTNFSFDGMGVCSTSNIGNALVDFEQLVKMNGVEDLRSKPEVKPAFSETAEASKEVEAEKKPKEDTSSRQAGSSKKKKGRKKKTKE